MGRGAYRGGSTVIGPRSGWFSFRGERKGPKTELLSVKEYRARLELAKALKQTPDVENERDQQGRLAKIGALNPDGSGLIKAEAIQIERERRARRVNNFATALAALYPMMEDRPGPGRKKRKRRKKK